MTAAASADEAVTSAGAGRQREGWQTSGREVPQTRIRAPIADQEPEFVVVVRGGVEPPTPRFSVVCSTN